MMSKALEEYGDRKSCAVTTAKRLAQFLGDERIKDKGLACNYVVATCAAPAPPGLVPCCVHAPVGFTRSCQRAKSARQRNAC
jgi:hypothetical protein